jgi:hypothetical protein
MLCQLARRVGNLAARLHSMEEERFSIINKLRCEAPPHLASLAD